MQDSIHVKYRHTKNFFKNSIEEIDGEISDVLFGAIDGVGAEVPRLSKRVVELNQMRAELIEKFLKVVESPTHVELIFTSVEKV